MAAVNKKSQASQSCSDAAVDSPDVPDATDMGADELQDLILELTTLSEIKELLMQSVVMLDDANEKISSMPSWVLDNGLVLDTLPGNCAFRKRSQQLSFLKPCQTS
eukprot:Skav234192  [mRNA]  locus=scaffold2984:104284:104601:+ [translate_table: standard]